MLKLVRLFFLVLVTLACGLGPAQTETGSNSGTIPSTAPAGDSRAELAALQSDVIRMRSLIQQMQNNMAFVGPTTAPLYHQFELEISMWQLQLEQTNRRIAALEKEQKQ